MKSEEHGVHIKVENFDDETGAPHLDLIPLYPHQIEGVAWMIAQELNDSRQGGILADEMGMGKTAQMISVIFSRKLTSPTLVVCPASVIMQWYDEIRRFNGPHSRVCIYGGLVKPSPAELRRYSVVLISYDSLGREFDQNEGNDEAEMKCDISDGKRVRQPTVSRSFAFEPRYSTSSLGLSEEKIREARNACNRSTGEPTVFGSSIFGLRWGRVVLDEAHSIRNPRTVRAKACCALVSDVRWCLSGTPVQNKIGDLFSLVKFLRFRPFSHLFCLSCSCVVYEIRSVDDRCADCGCWARSHASFFRQVMAREDGRLGILKSSIIESLMLRRIKASLGSRLNLAPLVIELRKVSLNPAERKVYNVVLQGCRFELLRSSKFNRRGLYFHFFELLTRLRQLCDHLLLLAGSPTFSIQGLCDHARGWRVCGVCHFPVISDAVQSPCCDHAFHRVCLAEGQRRAQSKGAVESDCPTCWFHAYWSFVPNTDHEWYERTRTPLPEKLGVVAVRDSSKIQAVMQAMREVPSTSKVVIFSQFVGLLDILDIFLTKNGFGCLKFSGMITSQKRRKILTTFNIDPAVRVLLISLKAGGEGLNLQVADHVFLLDSWWNPASELQALQRVHRIGQASARVRAIRFVVNDSVEEKILALQEKKKILFDAVIEGCHLAEQKLTQDDMGFLFDVKL